MVDSGYRHAILDTVPLTRSDHMRKLIVFVPFLWLLTTVLACTPGFAGRRVALVVGNAHYKDTRLNLLTPTNDARDVGDALKALGFDVVTVTDSDLTSFDGAISAFKSTARGAEIALFFYSGHTLAYDHLNYLIPTSFVINQPDQLKREAVSIEDIQEALSGVGGVQVMIIDACRINTFNSLNSMKRSIGPKEGVGHVPIQPRDAAVLYSNCISAALDGNVAGNSSFSAGLIEQLRQPGRKELSVLLKDVAAKVKRNTGGKQLPELMMSIFGAYHFDLSNDRAEWESVKNSPRPEDLQEFARRFPSSVFRVQAEQRAQTLTATGIKPQQQAKAQKEGESTSSTERPQTAASQAAESAPLTASLAQAEARAPEAEAPALEAEAKLQDAQAQLQSTWTEASRIEAEAKIRETDARSREADAQARALDLKRREKALALQQQMTPLQNIPDQGKRVALVIGNSAYQAVPMLPNPSRDAESVKDALEAARFTSVRVLENVTLGEMKKALREFKALADEADWAVVYFAGHGIEIGGKNFLIPIDAHLSADSDAEDEAVSLQYVLDKIHNAHNLRLVVVDACRDNPFANGMTRQIATRTVRRGLARYEPEMASELVFYAAKDGEQAQDGDTQGHSPFASAFVSRLMIPGLEINKFFRLVTSDVMQATANRQQPFMYGSTPGDKDFYFRVQ